MGMDTSTYKMYVEFMNQEQPPSHADLIRLWSSTREFARDMAMDVGVVEQWLRRSSIPGRYWAWMVLCGQKRAYAAVTLDNLSRAVSFREIAA
jgi:hypothetical protein